MVGGRSLLFSLLLLIGCSVPPSGAAPAVVTPARPGWQVMPHIKLAAFSAHDAREYDVMIFCDSDQHVRLYHLAPADEMSTELALRSGEVRTVIAGQRELVRATPPPVSSEEGQLLGARISGRLNRASQVWRAFEQSGMLEVQSGAHVTGADAASSEREALATLFSGCA
jgi:hypothetical protein